MDALQITLPLFTVALPPPTLPCVIEQEKNLFPAFEKIKSIFDNGESITGSFIALSQQAPFTQITIQWRGGHN